MGVYARLVEAKFEQTHQSFSCGLVKLELMRWVTIHQPPLHLPLQDRYGTYTSCHFY
jgi:hypothetical protein